MRTAAPTAPSRRRATQRGGSDARAGCRPCPVLINIATAQPRPCDIHITRAAALAGSTRASPSHRQTVGSAVVRPPPTQRHPRSDRTVRRAVAEVKANHRRGRRRVYRPWIAKRRVCGRSGTGAPVRSSRAGGRICFAWLAWSRFRVVIATWDRTLPTVIACVDRAMRALGGAPTYWLTDNERTVTIDHVARDRCAPSGDRRGRRPLRDHGGNVRASGSRVQGRVRGDREGRQGRCGANRREPARQLPSW